MFGGVHKYLGCDIAASRAVGVDEHLRGLLVVDRLSLGFGDPQTALVHAECDGFEVLSGDGFVPCLAFCRRATRSSRVLTERSLVSILDLYREFSIGLRSGD